MAPPLSHLPFSYRAPAGLEIAEVDLVGETSDWRNAVQLARQADGTFAVSLDLPAGVYQYKLRVRTTSAAHAEWLVDPENARTRAAGGHRNSIVVVDGAPEPWLFAPAAPWVVALERGGLRVLVGRRRAPSVEATERPTVAFSEDHGVTWSRVQTEHAFDEDEHVFFTAALPASAAEIVLALEARDAPRFEARWRRPPAVLRPPRWWSDAVLYCIFVDRFRPEHDRVGWERDPGKRVVAGGHLEGIRRSLDELVELGVDVLYLTPVHVGASAHRYDVVDPLRIDPALGGEDAYAALASDARSRGMRIVQDVSFAHAGRGFPPYEDVRANGAASRFAPWFVWKDGALVHYGKRTDAPLFDQDSAEVQALALETIELWAKRGASGLRLDMTAELPIALGQRIRRRFRELVPDGVVFGELVPQHAWRWRLAQVIDAATDFDFFEVVRDLILRPDASAADAFAALRRSELLRGDDARVHAVRFLATHDHARLATLAACSRDPAALRRLPCAYVLLATLPGIPMLLYGEEHGLRSMAVERDPEDVWPDRMPMPWTATGRDPEAMATLRALLRMRKGSDALRQGRTQLLFADATTLVYRRESDAEVVDVAVNLASEPKALELEDDEHPRLEAIASVGGATASDACITLPPCSALIARREGALGRRTSPLVARKNLLLRDADLASAAAVASARPSRFFFAVTERCNLRCEHCITHAPERTRTGSARTMTPAVLDALTPDLGLADYFAFVHGGESLTAPIFFDVLEAIARARGDAPYVAHLLTNGVLLGRETARRLVGLGVSSISISLDGATAATNDAIRAGGRFDDVVANVRDVVRWRAAENVDLRIGLSTVVLAQNLPELGALVDLGAELGVDWIKLEEGVPATPFAKRSLVSCTAPEVRRGIDEALARGRARGLVMVDHTVDRELWRCRLDEPQREFLEADEHANRCMIHPCRTPWDTVCIEPNGDVRARDFFGPVLGNATETPLAALWNAEPAQRLRRDAASSRLCGPSGPVVCVAAS